MSVTCSIQDCGKGPKWPNEFTSIQIFLDIVNGNISVDHRPGRRSLVFNPCIDGKAIDLKTYNIVTVQDLVNYCTCLLPQETVSA